MSDSTPTPLPEIIYEFALKAKQVTVAERSTVWLVDAQNHEFWTVIHFNHQSLQEIRIPRGKGYVGIVDETKSTLNIPFDIYNHPNAGTIRQTDQKTGYRTCSLLGVPILHPQGEIMGVIQLINKCKDGEFSDYNPTDWPEAPEVFKASFDQQDETKIIRLATEISQLISVKS